MTGLGLSVAYRSHTQTHLDRGKRAFSSLVLSTEHTNRPGNMSSKDIEPDYDSDFEYDYHTLRVGGLIFAGVVVVLSFLLLLGNKITNCGKKKPKNDADEED
ncbi:sodium/potassium-transporting ATPase subunit gamma-like [Cololabis saira]|uniref:sodium/potassium-transporting ATPase subunit gamma-like n=1 Tax=Cololabis saira TaxID=129043 RepID=UPI002AD1F304|nr:sodium/potassium-transporting ATPase subunit gamma-like [Cololabis saira]